MHFQPIRVGNLQVANITFVDLSRVFKHVVFHFYNIDHLSTDVTHRHLVILLPHPLSCHLHLQFFNLLSAASALDEFLDPFLRLGVQITPILHLKKGDVITGGEGRKGTVPSTNVVPQVLKAIYLLSKPLTTHMAFGIIPFIVFLLLMTL